MSSSVRRKGRPGKGGGKGSSSRGGRGGRSHKSHGGGSGGGGSGGNRKSSSRIWDDGDDFCIFSESRHPARYYALSLFKYGHSINSSSMGQQMAKRKGEKCQVNYSSYFKTLPSPFL